MKFYLKSNLLKNLLLFLLFVPIVYATLFFIATYSLKINVKTNINSELQVFYKINSTGNYSEINSIKKNLFKGDNNIVISLNEYSNKIRIDIANEAYQASIESIVLEYLFYKVPLTLDTNSSVQIYNTIINSDKSIEIITEKNANDPQLIFIIEKSKLNKNVFLINLFLSLLISIIFLFLKAKFSSISKLVFQIELYIKSKFEYIKNIGIEFSKFYIYFLIGFVFHIFEIANFLISPDDEYSAFRVNPEAWIYDGRWLAFLIEKFIFDQPTMPFIPNIASCILMAFSYIFLLNAHSIKSNWKTYLIYPIFSAFPTLWMINEFYGNMVIVAFGFFVASISILLFSDIVQKIIKVKPPIFKIYLNILIPSIFLSFAIASYQSFVMLGVSAVFGILLFKMYREQIVNIKVYLITGMLYIINSVVIYAVLNKIFKFIYPSDYNYVGGFVRLSDINFLEVLIFVKNSMLSVYSGSVEFFGVSLTSIGIIILLIFVNIVFIHKNKILFFGLSISLLLTPFFLHFISGGIPLPSRSMVSLPYVVWLLSLILMFSRNYLSKVFGVIVVLILLIQQSSALGQYAAATRIGQMQDRLLAFDIYTRMSNINPDFNPDDTHIVDIYGYKTIDTIYPKIPTSTINSSFFDWDAGNMSRIVSYMRLIGYSNVKMIDKTLIEKNVNYFKNMQKYPNIGSVQYIDGIYLIKLGDNPDVYRRK